MRASDRIGYPVHPTIRSPDRWHRAADALTQQIKASATVTVFDRGDGAHE
jgi:hypothetical protein